MRAPITTLAALLACCAGLLLWMRPRPADEPAPAPQAVPPGEVPPFAFRWPAGQVLRYRLEWRTAQHAAFAGQGALEGGVDLAGELRVRALGEHQGATALGVELAALERHEVSALGHKLAEQPGALEGHEAVALVEPTGELRSVGFAAGHPALFRHVLAALLAQAEVTVRPGEQRWTTSGRGPFGPSRLRYERSAAAPLAVARVREAYEAIEALATPPGPGASVALSSGASAILDPAGYLRSLRDQETLAVSEAGTERLRAAAELSLELIAIEASKRPARALAGLQWRRPGEPPAEVAPDQRKQMLEQRADGLSGPQMLSDLRRASKLGMLRDHERWFWRATGRLLAEPALAAGIGELVKSGALEQQGSALAFDLLSGAGHREAQAAMRAALSSERVRGDEKLRARIVQSFGFLQQPDPASLAAVGDLYADARRAGTPLDLRTAAFTLGAMAGAAAHADTGRAQQLAHGLEADLSAAGTAEERDTLLRALGNARLESEVPALLPYATAADPAVRRAAAIALRYSGRADARDALLSLASDGDRDVQRSAIEMLAPKLGDAEVSALSALVQRGGVARSNEPSVVSAIAERGDRGPAAQALLRYLSEHGGREELRQRALALLGGR